MRCFSPRPFIALTKKEVAGVSLKPRSHRWTRWWQSCSVEASAKKLFVVVTQKFKKKELQKESHIGQGEASNTGLGGGIEPKACPCNLEPKLLIATGIIIRGNEWSGSQRRHVQRRMRLLEGKFVRSAVKCSIEGEKYNFF